MDTSSGSEVDEDLLIKHVYRESYSESDDSLEKETDEDNTSYTGTPLDSNSSQKYNFEWKPLVNTHTVVNKFDSKNSENKNKCRTDSKKPKPTNSNTENEKEKFGISSESSENSRNENNEENASFSNSQYRKEKFCVNNIGLTKTYAHPYEAFTAIWDQKIIEHIVTETNRYAIQSNIDKWQDTTVDEMYVYLGLILQTTIIVIDVIKEYWNGDGFGLRHFSYLMPYERFKQLTNCIHFIDNDNLRDIKNDSNNSQIKMLKLQPLIDHLNDKFSSLYNIEQNIALDEGLTQWNGWIVNTRRICIEPDPVEIKSLEICEPKTGYLWQVKLVPGDITTNMIPGLVVELLKGLEGKGHTVWMNKFYSSPALARQLKQLGFDCAGLLKKSRLPPEVFKTVRNLTDRMKKKKNNAHLYGCTSDDVDIYAWIDNTTHQNLITTYHGLQEVKSGKTKAPDVLLDYNLIMQGIQKKDNLLFKFPMERKQAHIWYKMFFRKLLNASILNAHILYNKENMKHHIFRREICWQIFNRHRSKSPSAIFPPDEENLHFLVQCVLMTNQRQVMNKCSKCENMTEWCCYLCKFPLCESSCFEDFHNRDSEDSCSDTCSDSDHHEL